MRKSRSSVACAPEVGVLGRPGGASCGPASRSGVAAQEAEARARRRRSGAAAARAARAPGGPAGRRRAALRGGAGRQVLVAARRAPALRAASVAIAGTLPEPGRGPTMRPAAGGAGALRGLDPVPPRPLGAGRAPGRRSRWSSSTSPADRHVADARRAGDSRRSPSTRIWAMRRPRALHRRGSPPPRRSGGGSRRTPRRRSAPPARRRGRSSARRRPTSASTASPAWWP